MIGAGSVREADHGNAGGSGKRGGTQPLARTGGADTTLVGAQRRRVVAGVGHESADQEARQCGFPRSSERSAAAHGGKCRERERDRVE